MVSLAVVELAGGVTLMGARRQSSQSCQKTVSQLTTLSECDYPPCGSKPAAFSVQGDTLLKDFKPENFPAPQSVTSQATHALPVTVVGNNNSKGKIAAPEVHSS